MAKELMEIGGFITEGAEIVNHDASLSGNGTVDSPLGVVPGYNETVLWENSAGAQLVSGFTAQLTENISGFDRIYVYHGTDNLKWSHIDTFPGAANRFELTRYSYDGGSYIIQDCQDLTTNDGLNFSAKRNIRRAQFNTNGSFSLSTNQNTTFKLFKIVGINRIANS